MNSFKLKNFRSMRSVFAQTIIWRGRRGNWGKSELVCLNQRFGHPSLVPICPVLQRVGPSMLCSMLGERSWVSLQLVSSKDLPHTYSCTCFYSKQEKQRWKQTRTMPILNTEESKLYWIKTWFYLVHYFFINLFLLFIFSLFYVFFYSWQAEYNG